MSFEMCGIDHQPIRLATLRRQFGEDAVEYPKSAPADETVVDRFVRTVILRRIAPRAGSFIARRRKIAESRFRQFWRNCRRVSAVRFHLGDA
jgi:hypothetical protein